MGAVGAGVEFEDGELNFVADFLDGRSDDGGGIFGVAELEVHPASDVLQLEHGASPGGPGDGDLHGLRAKFRMAGKKRLASPQQNSRVAMVQSLNLQDGRWRKVVEKDAAFDFRADDAAVYFVGQVGVRAKHTDDRH